MNPAQGESCIENADLVATKGAEIASLDFSKPLVVLCCYFNAAAHSYS
jgi:hypothetical protein